MSRHDEHGSVDVDEREHGPEWWAMGSEVCTCGHRVDQHQERVDSIDSAAGTHSPCDACAYQDLEQVRLDKS